MIREDNVDVLKREHNYAIVPLEVIEKFLKTQNIMVVMAFLRENAGCSLGLDPNSSYQVVKKYKVVNKDGRKYTDAFIEIRDTHPYGKAERLLLQNEATEEEFINQKMEQQGLKVPESIQFIEEFHKQWEDSLA